MTQGSAAGGDHALEIAVSQTTDTVLVELGGELDLAGAGRLEHELVALTEPPGRPIVLDLRSLDFMDSTGLSVLVRFAQAARAAGRELRLRRGNERIQRLFAQSGTAEQFVFVPEG